MDDNIHITPAFCYHIQHSPVAKDHDCLRLLSMKIKIKTTMWQTEL